MRKTIDVSPDVWLRLKVEAAHRNEPVARLVGTILEWWLTVTDHHSADVETGSPANVVSDVEDGD